MKTGGLSLFLLLVLTCVSNISAGIRASFSLDYSAWHSTHIVIAGEGAEIDGNFTVFESLRGDLGSGETIFIEPLAVFQSPSLRKVMNWEAQPVLPEKYVSGARVILFLKKNPDSKQLWEPPDLFKDFKASLVWIEPAGTFAVIQVSNPGPSVLVDYEKTETDIKNRIFEITELKNSLRAARRIEDAAERAAALERFAVSDFIPARIEAFEALKNCGKNAVPVLRKMLRDEALLKIHDQLIESLATVGGTEAGNDLTEIVRRELSFWKRAAPALEIGWWNRMDNPEIENLRNRYSKVSEALRQLKILKFANSRRVVTQFRNFWRSLPQLEDKNGTARMSEECDELLRALESK